MTKTLPSYLRPTSAQIVWRSNALVNRSPLSGAVQTLARMGGAWAASLSWESLSRADAYRIHARLASADFGSTAFLIGPDEIGPADLYDSGVSWRNVQSATFWLDAIKEIYALRYLRAPTVLMAAAGTAGDSTIDIDGLGGAGFNEGDWFDVDNGTYRELHQFAQDVAPNSSGAASGVAIHPPLRRDVADNTVLTYIEPRGEFILANGDQAQISKQRNGSYSVRAGFGEFVR